MKILPLKLTNNGYNIYLGQGSLKLFHSLCLKAKLPKRKFYIIDSNVYQRYKTYFETSLFETKRECIHIIPSGEKSKSFNQIEEIHKVMLANKFGRDTLVVAIGGGVTGDASGFAASIFMRGVPVVHLPTTLLAAVDSSVGGKTGINFSGTKNIIGTFYQPKFVLIDSTFFQTLPDAEITCGMGEIIKYAFLSGKSFYDNVKKLSQSFYNKDFRKTEKIIASSIQIKTEVVANDEKESGLRKILNFGHTFAHAFESELNFRIKHGEAVTAGIICALYLSHRKGFLSDQLLHQLLELPLTVRLPRAIKKPSKENLYQVMLSDKKNRDGKIKFVLLKNLGEILLDVEAEKEEVFFAFDKMFTHIQ